MREEYVRNGVRIDGKSPRYLLRYYRLDVWQSPESCMQGLAFDIRIIFARIRLLMGWMFLA